MFSRFNANKCKTQAKMCVSRVKLMRNKRLIGLKQLRREVAELLKQGKQGNARIRVEAVIRENFTLQAYDILELFLELVSVRVPLMEKAKEMPPDMMEAICSLIYAGDRMSTDLPEMAVIRHILVSKYSPVYGKEFAMEASSELTCRKWHVNENLVSCLVIEAPSPQEKIRVLSEIAAEHGVEFDEEAAAADMLTGAAPRPAAAAAAEAPAPYPAPYGAPPPWAQPGFVQPPPVAAAAPGMPPAAAAPPPATAPPGAEASGTMAGWAPLQPTSAQPGDGFQGHIASTAAYLNAKRTDTPPKGDAYTDASAAAEAARQYSTMAQQAADAAEQYAKTQQHPGGQGAPPPGDGGAAGGGGGGGLAAARPPWAAGAASGGPYVQRSDSEIQRAYDAAPGPPSKGELSTAGPPSAPPAPPAAAPGGAGPSGGIAGAHGAAGADAGAGDDLGLPSAPAGGRPAAEQSEVDQELDELTRRLEALKRR